MSRYFPRVLLIGVICLSLIISATSMAWASSPHITLSPDQGHPSISVKIAGSGFGMRETVSLSFDATPVGTATTNYKGAFTRKIIIPASASPGKHTVQAIGNTSGLSASTSFLVRTDWAMFGFDTNHTNYNPYENVLSPANISLLVSDWQMTTGNGIVSEPAIVNNILYVGSTDHNLYAVNAHTGTLLWKTVTGGEIAFSVPAVAKGIVYVGSLDGKVYAFNAQTGIILWTALLGNEGVEASPTIVNGIVYISSSDGIVYALNAYTGATLWSVNTGTNTYSLSPTVSGGFVFFGSGKQMNAYNANTGTLVWSTSGHNLFITSSPVISNGEVYVTTGDGAGYNEVDGFNISTGVLDWSFGANYIETAPTIDNQTMFFGLTGEVFAVDIPTRELLWASTNQSSFYTATMAANGVVYATDGNGNISAFNAANGITLWTNPLSPGYELQASPVVVNGIVYIGSGDHHLYAFHLPNN